MALRVLYISANGFPATSTDARGTFSLEHAQALRRLGIDVDAVDMSRERFGRDEVDGLVIVRVPRLRGMLRKLDFVGILRYAKFFRARKADGCDAVVFGFFYLKYLPLIVYLRARHRAIVVIAQGGDVMPGGALRGLAKRLMFRLVDVVTPGSEFTEAIFSCLIRRRQCDNRKIVTIHNGVDPEKMRSTVGREAMRQRLGLPPADFVVLSVCNLVRRKGLHILVQAVDMLASEGHPIRHVMIGRGPERHRLAELAAANGNADRFTFIDAVEASELANHYEMADLFAMVSITDWDTGQVEGFGITYAEAMALGKPVIGGGGSGTTTPIKHGFTGLLVDPYRPDVVQQVAAGLRRFMDDREFYERISAGARLHVAEHLTWARNAERTKATIEAVLRAKHASGSREAGAWPT